METKALTPLNKILDLLLDAICVVDVEGRYVFVSAAFERIFGYTADEVIGRRMIELVHPEDREITLRTAAQIMAGHHQSHFHNRYIRKNGEIVHIMWSARWSEADQVRIAVARDITELRRGESMRSALHAISEAAHAADSLHALFEQVHRIIGELLPAGNFLVALLDRKRGEISFPYVVDERVDELDPQPLDADTLIAQVIRTGQTALQDASAHPALLPDGSPSADDKATHWLGVPLNAKDGTIGALAVKSYSDTTRYSEADQELLQFVSTQIAAAIARKLTEARLHHLAQHDSLTDLPNRELFYRQFDTALDNARRHQSHIALLYIDLDRFKQVNDNFGHHIGDLLLCEVAVRIRRCLRECDVVGRVGGDEFVVLLSAIQSPSQGLDVAERIREALGAPFQLANQCIRISTSIGVANYPAHSEDADLLTKAADHAMYHAKKEGGNRALIATLPDSAQGPQADFEQAP
ncbi:diguanylate cyclase [Dyella halodurans]|uniref:Diguanylate cyclase domain-containing protein n=1 Tax=Dyella halodurans TaxID=1920171 RepID=A0ABV9C3L8_9GAMM|nr:GGDEF domain-containing protein [Dyella halodurans]